MTVVDAHSHFLPLELVEFLRQGNHPDVRVEDADGRPPLLVYASGTRFPLTPNFHDPEAILGEMDRVGIDVSLLSVAAPLFFYELDPATSLEVSRLLNDAAAQLARESGGRLHAMATVPLNAPEDAAQELRRARRELGLRGVEIGASVGATMLDAPELDPFFAVAAELEMPVFIHPYTSMLGDGRPPGLDRYFLSNSVGNPLETHRAAACLILGGVLDRHPRLLVQLAHAGGSLPYQLSRVNHTYGLREEVRAVAARPPFEYLDHFLFDTVIYDERPLDFLLSLVGPERVVFGTDYPFDMADLTGLGLRSRLSAADAERVLESNARGAYGL
ncbi:MAG: amidohydrolase family protein [Solirubrobacteraceae bacterium]